MNRSPNRDPSLNPRKPIIDSWGIGEWIGACLIEYWAILIGLLDVCLVCKDQIIHNLNTVSSFFYSQHILIPR